MKLFGWKPKGHGEYSFFVVADSEEKAQLAVNEYIKNHKLRPDECQGWGTDYYELEVAEVGQVLYNCNE
jgi:hypothetical protein